MTTHTFPAEARDLTFDDLRVGDCVGYDVTIDAEDVDRYAALTGDRNPLHVSPEYARRAGFPDRLVHGMLTASIGSVVCGMLLPGRRALLLSQKADFVEAVPVGATLTVSAKVVFVSPGLRGITLNVLALRGGLVVMRQTLTVRVREDD